MRRYRMPSETINGLFLNNFILGKGKEMERGFLPAHLCRYRSQGKTVDALETPEASAGMPNYSIPDKTTEFLQREQTPTLYKAHDSS